MSALSKNLSASCGPSVVRMINPEQENAIRELMEAKAQLNCAISNFNNCIPEFFDIANQELTIAEMQFNTHLKKIKTLMRVSPSG